MGPENEEFYKVSRALVDDWLKTIFTLTGMLELGDAMIFVHHTTLSESDKSIVYTITNFIRAEASGLIDPPVHIYLRYKAIAVEQSEKGVADEQE